MLSEIIKKKIELKAGHLIRYSRDCDALAHKISSECNCTISGSTLRRLFGFVKGTKEPRVYTLDLLAKYIGYPTWEELLLDITGSAPDKVITEIRTTKLKQGERFVLGYRPDTTLTIEYIGKSKFRVLSAKNSQLNEGDLFKASVISLHHPLFVLDIEGHGNKESRLLEARVSGIISIEKL